MPIQTPGAHPRARLQAMSSALKVLHGRLLEIERRAYERQIGRIANPMFLLRLAAEDPQFAWIRPLMREITRLDESALSHATTQFDADLMATRIRALLLGVGRTTPFLAKYQDIANTDPDVIFAQADVLRSLGQEKRPRILALPGEPTSVIRPGDVVPGLVGRVLGCIAGIGSDGAEIPSDLRAFVFVTARDDGEITVTEVMPAGRDVRWWIAIGRGSVTSDVGGTTEEGQPVVTIVDRGPDETTHISRRQLQDGGAWHIEVASGQLAIVCLFGGQVVNANGVALPRFHVVPPTDTITGECRGDVEAVVIRLPWHEH